MVESSVFFRQGEASPRQTNRSQEVSRRLDISNRDGGKASGQRAVRQFCLMAHPMSHSLKSIYLVIARTVGTLPPIFRSMPGNI